MQMQVLQWVNNSQPAAQSVHGALVRHIPEICDQNPMYFRYLDGICILWDHGETQFQTFFDFKTLIVLPFAFQEDLRKNQ